MVLIEMCKCVSVQTTNPQFPVSALIGTGTEYWILTHFHTCTLDLALVGPPRRGGRGALGESALPQRAQPRAAGAQPRPPQGEPNLAPQARNFARHRRVRPLITAVALRQRDLDAEESACRVRRPPGTFRKAFAPFDDVGAPVAQIRRPAQARFAICDGDRREEFAVVRV